jgi:hypothetical protein
MTVQTICEAIRRRNLVSFIVIADGSGRIVEPHAFGWGVNGRHVLWTWCVSTTENESTLAGAWMLCHLDQMRGVQVLAERFAGPRPNYRRANIQIPKIVCQL